MIKKSIYTFLGILLPLCIVNAQRITTDDSQNPQQLIQNLVGENCASASNISSQLNGNDYNITSYGSFNRGTSDFPLENGIILSTGSVSRAGNSIITDDLSDGSIDWTTDPDILEIIGIDQTLNATSIEFDLVTNNNFVAFRYLFASDEYQQEYPCNFRDVFAIFIKRAGTADPYVNIALVPETTTEITTSNIRPNINGFCEALNENYFEGYNIGSTNFSGHTTVLTASSEVTPGDTYHVKFVIADHIDQRFDSAVFIEAESFGGAIDLGPDQSICGSDLILDADVDNPTASYSWFLNGNPILGETNSTLDVDESGSYSVEVSLPFNDGSCTLTDTIDIEIVPFQPAAPIEDLFVCDVTLNDGIYDFDFPFLKDDEILAELPSNNYLISYHLTQDDAQNNINPIEGIYQNSESEETIFVRIVSLDGSCLQVGSFNLTVTLPPNITTLNFSLDICFDFIIDPGITELNQFDVVMANSELNRVVTYYLSESDAISRTNAITDFPDFGTQPEFIVGRVEIAGTSNDCFSLAYLNFNYLTPPELGVDRLILNECIDPNYEEIGDDGTVYTYNNLPVTFDIESYFEFIENTLFPGSSVFTLELYGLGNPRTLVLSNQQSFTLRLGIAIENGNCQTEIPLVVHKNLLFNVIGENNEFFLCDDSSNDNIVDFNLEDVASGLKDGYEEIDLDFYLTETDLITGSNALDQSQLLTVTNEQTLFIGSSYDGCSFNSQVTLKINPTLTLSDYTFDYCGYTDISTNTTSIILDPLKENIINDLGISGIVEIYESLEDAEAQENIISDNFYNLAENQNLYIRVTDLFTGCHDTSTLQLNITPIVEAINVDPIIICDEDQNLIAEVNLESVLENLETGEENVTFTFHDTLDQALSEFYEFLSIPNPDSYVTQSAEFYIRAQLDSGGCFTVLNFEVQIYNDPQLNPVTDFINCEVDPDIPSNFIFEDKDSQIINNQDGMQVLYFESEDDAINRENPIDKTLPYQNISNPQTIYVRLENEIGNACFKVEPMQIEVRQTPIYNLPTDIFECDINNNGIAITDLNTKVSEIELGSPTNLSTSFHLTPLNAELGTNEIPLNFTAENNPQLIYARIENIDSGCYNVETFTLNTLSLPQVNFGQSLTSCGNDFETNLQWNLTEIELNIIDGRQYNIDYTYYISEEDAELDIDPIINPTDFTNTSSPQTLYVRVRNLSTGCYDIVPFDLIINNPPEINPIENYSTCENENSYVDLSEIDLALLENTFNILVSYYTSETDALADANALSTDYTYTDTIEELYARVEFTTTRCYTIHPFNLVINPLPVANQPDDLIACDDDFDALVEFDLTSQNTNILNGLNPDDYFLSYFNSEEDAFNDLNELDSSYVAFDNEIIYVRLENIATGCFDTTQFAVIINPLPIVNIDDQVLCLNDLPLTISAETGNPLDTYQWSTNSTASEVSITEIGTYSVTITNEFGCENTSTFSVTSSESANIEFVETIDFSDPNNITISISGIGNYLYQLNDLPFQTSNVFINVPIGYNTVTIIDQNGCDRITREVLVIDAPKHMSPNSDGHFDTWHIVGAETLPGTIIYIFDRYGKLLKTLSHNSPGWNGTFNGNLMPADDYWYTAEIIQNGERFEFSGHFALRR